ncbi:MAG: hypothetical protein AAF989_04125 [Planctomycetota bacterium]
MSKPELRLITDEHGRRANASGQRPCCHESGQPHSHQHRKRTERELDRIAGAADAKTVSLSVRSLVPLLMEAAECDRTWLQDFAEDPVRIDADLYDVLLAYQQLSQQRAD